MSSGTEAERNWYCVSILLKCKVNIDTGILQKAVDALTDRHDMLRAVYSDRYYIREPGASVCTVKENKIRSLSAGLSFVRNELKSLSLREGKLMSVCKIQYGAGKDRVDYVMIAIHQMVMSFYQWPVVLDDLSEAYRSISKGERPNFHPKTVSYKEWLALQDVALTYDEMKYWKNISEKINNVDQKKTAPFLIETKIKPSSISEAMEDVSTRKILLVALMQAYGKLMGRETMTVRIKGHGTHLADCDHTVGWFTNLYPLELNITGDLDKDIDEVRSKTEAVPNDGVGYGMIYGNDMKVHLPDMTFCYSEDFHFENDLFKKLKRPNRGHSFSDMSVGENMSIYMSEHRDGYIMRGFVSQELSALPQKFAERIKELYDLYVTTSSL